MKKKNTLSKVEWLTTNRFDLSIEGSFNEYVFSEHKKRSFFTTKLKEMLAAAGHQNVPVDEAYEITPHLQTRESVLLSSHILIVPYAFKEANLDQDLPAADKLHILHDMLVGHGFEGRGIENDHNICISTFYIDKKATDLLQRHLGDEKAEKALLKLRTILSASDHDWLHNTSSLLMPEFTDGYIDLSEEHENTLQKLYNAKTAGTHDRPHSSIMCGLTQIEQLSFEIQYRVMQFAYKQNPRLKERLLEQAVDYLQAIQEIKPAMTNGHPELAQKSDDLTMYMSNIYLRFMYTIIKMDDPDLDKKTRQGISVNQAINDLQLAPRLFNAALVAQMIYRNKLEPGAREGTFVPRHSVDIPTEQKIENLRQTMNAPIDSIPEMFQPHIQALKDLRKNNSDILAGTQWLKTHLMMEENGLRGWLGRQDYIDNEHGEPELVTDHIARRIEALVKFTKDVVLKTPHAKSNTEYSTRILKHIAYRLDKRLTKSDEPGSSLQHLWL